MAEVEEQEFISINEAAKMFGVSPQTLRNWSEAGEIKFKRTKGGHRRYNTKDLEEKKKEFDQKVVSNYEYLLNKETRANIISKAKEDTEGIIPDNEESNAFYFPNLEEYRYLMYNNFDLCNQSLDAEFKKELRKLYAEELEALLAPKLVKFSTMYASSELQPHAVKSGNNVAIYMCEVVRKTQEAKYHTHFWDQDGVLYWKENVKTIKQLDEEIINDISCIAPTADSITSAVDQITNDAAVKPSVGYFWVMYPPELDNYSSEISKINEMSDFKIKSFRSRLVKEDEILVGFRGDDLFNGYIFMPFCLVAADYINYHTEGFGQKIYKMYYGKRLTYGSQNYFRKIKV